MVFVGSALEEKWYWVTFGDIRDLTRVYVVLVAVIVLGRGVAGPRNCHLESWNLFDYDGFSSRMFAHATKQVASGTPPAREL